MERVAKRILRVIRHPLWSIVVVAILVVLVLINQPGTIIWNAQQQIKDWFYGKSYYSSFINDDPGWSFCKSFEIRKNDERASIVSRAWSKTSSENTHMTQFLIDYNWKHYDLFIGVFVSSSTQGLFSIYVEHVKIKKVAFYNNSHKPDELPGPIEAMPASAHPRYIEARGQLIDILSRDLKSQGRSEEIAQVVKLILLDSNEISYREFRQYSAVMFILDKIIATIMFSSIYTLIYIPKWFRIRKRMKKKGQCLKCGYSLDGIDGICPECGKSIKQ